MASCFKYQRTMPILNIKQKIRFTTYQKYPLKATSKHYCVLYIITDIKPLKTSSINIICKKCIAAMYIAYNTNDRRRRIPAQQAR